MRQAHEIQRVPLVIRDLDECALVVGLEDGANGPRRPPAGIDNQLDDVKSAVSGMSHQDEVSQGVMGYPPKWRPGGADERP
jgi:hypothetical protein